MTAGPNGIEVDFVDPDAGEREGAERDVDAESPEALDLRSLALVARPDGRAVGYLLGELGRVRSAVEGELQARKDAALATMQEPGFWEDEGRFAVLHEAEYLDRLEAAYETSARLGERLSRQAGKGNGAGELAGLLSLRLYVLQSAITGLDEGRTADLFLRLQLSGRDGHCDEAARWLEEMAAMYVAWAERRGMRLKRLSPDEHLYAISGLGADEILAAETGASARAPSHRATAST